MEIYTSGKPKLYEIKNTYSPFLRSLIEKHNKDITDLDKELEI